ncbi:MAG: single-stranded-DNA-specific exonuclease RecJ [Pseudomonadota bacterium]
MRDADPAQALAISQRLGLEEIVGRVLASRGVAAPEAEAFLAPRLKDWLPDPSHLHDLDQAVTRLAAAIESGETVGIIGDYDVDGATSSALAAHYLEAVGTRTVIEIPDRLTDGYGPNNGAFERLKAQGCRLVLVLDSGTTAFEPLAHAKSLGLEVIVVDHHAAEGTLPEALAVINPNRADQTSPLSSLAAVGVTFILLVGLNRELRHRGLFRPSDGRPAPDLLNWLDLVALGTVCDVVPLTGLNRAFVAQGLRVTARGNNPGLKALGELIKAKPLASAFQLGFLVGPRLNAGGRMGESGLAAELLRAGDAATAAAIAAKLDALNQERQSTERGVTEAAKSAVAGQIDADWPVLFAVGEGWHQGVLGITASRLVDRFQRPVFVIGMDQGVGKGSGRSVPGFDMGAAVIAARRAGLLVRAGGHTAAAGLTVEESALSSFQEFVNERAEIQRQSKELCVRPLDLDGELAVSGVTSAIAETIEKLAPFGEGNVEPRFCVNEATIYDRRRVGDNHVSCVLTNPAGGRVRAIAFRSADTAVGKLLLEASTPVRVAGRVKVETYQGRQRTGFHIDDAAPLT